MGTNDMFLRWAASNKVHMHVDNTLNEKEAKSFNFVMKPFQAFPSSKKEIWISKHYWHDSGSSDISFCG